MPPRRAAKASIASSTASTSTAGATNTRPTRSSRRLSIKPKNTTPKKAPAGGSTRKKRVIQPDSDDEEDSGEETSKEESGVVKGKKGGGDEGAEEVAEEEGEDEDAGDDSDDDESVAASLGVGTPLPPSAKGKVKAPRESTSEAEESEEDEGEEKENAKPSTRSKRGQQTTSAGRTRGGRTPARKATDPAPSRSRRGRSAASKDVDEDGTDVALEGSPAPAQSASKKDPSMDSDTDSSSPSDEDAPEAPPADTTQSRSQPQIADPEDLMTEASQRTAIEAARKKKQEEEEAKGPKKRLTIHKMVLINFKSYAGRQEIGPFHKSFSAIVGPNGSGKSNTIDALLFVFGWRASKMRQGKLSELIHNSQESERQGGFDSCSVEVHFREIIDLPGPDAFEVVPNTNLVVARTAFKNNSSKYTINGTNSTFTEVTTLLKEKGIDLDHKRFLILQGEVESIAQMKPKAPNEHEDGLLEYLEDIIGTSRYKEDIEKASEDVDKLNDERGEKLNRVKIVEREKAALEVRKKEADAFLKDQNLLYQKQSVMFQINIQQSKTNLEVSKTDVETITTELEAEVERQKGGKKEVEDLQAAYDESASEFKVLEKQTETIVKDLAAIEREDIQMQEKKKHFDTKQKKLKKSVTEDSHAKSEAEHAVKNYGEEIEQLRSEIEESETNLAKEEAELYKIQEGLKDKTDVFSRQIESKQMELQPWAAKIAERQAAIDIAKSERDLLVEKTESVKKGMEEVEAGIEKLGEERQEKTAKLEDLKKEKKQVEKDMAAGQKKIQDVQTKDRSLRLKVSNARNKADEAKASQVANRSRGDVLSSLTRLKEMGRLDGFHGRLGNLGRIDDKYDVAISTACPGLDNLVVDTVEIGQACLEHLRRNSLGRATVMCLKALKKHDISPIQTPENAPRLFDLITPKEPEFAPAFFQVLNNTLVAKDLPQANRIAFGGKERWRVVTLDGKLIDTSGTMSGGGNRVAKGSMSSKFAAEEVQPEVVIRLEKERDGADQELRDFLEERKQLEDELEGLANKLPEIDLQISKIEMELKGSEGRMREAEKRLADLKAQAKPEAGDVKKIADLEKSIASSTKELESFETKSEAIEGQIKALQDKILEIGGVKLRTQQAKVRDLNGMIDHANDRLSKAEVGKSKSEKDTSRLEKNVASNTKALKEVEDELAQLVHAIQEKAEAARLVRKAVEDARAVLEQKKEELEEMKEQLDESIALINQLRAKELDLKQKLEKAQRLFKESQQSHDHWTAKLQSLQLNEIDEDEDEDEEATNEGEKRNDDDERGEESKGRAATTELKVYSEEELAQFSMNRLKADVAELEERLDIAKPNLAVLGEYRKREKEFLHRAKDLEKMTERRDAAKKVHDDLRKRRLEEFMEGFQIISMKLKEMYQMITLGGNAELELVDSLDPFSEGIIFSVMPPKKSWKNIAHLSGGEKTLSSLALVFALHVFKPTPLYFMDEIDAALDFRNVSIIASYIKDRTKNAQSAEQHVRACKQALRDLQDVKLLKEHQHRQS